MNQAPIHSIAIRLNALAAAVVMTVAMLASIDRLASDAVASPAMLAHTATPAAA